MELRQLRVNDGRDIYEMLQRISPDENKFKNEVNGMSFEEFKKWLIKQNSWANGENLPDGYVRQWTYWLYDENVPVGYGKLREKVTEESRKFGGNIGFAIDPLQRGKGYGNILFEKLLEMAKKKNITEIFSTVEKFNYPSKKVHEKCGGKIVDENDERWFFSFAVNGGEYNMNYYVDENIKNTIRVFPGQGRYDFFRYDMNENPEGLPEEFVEKVKEKITPEFLSIYPEPDRFLKKYAAFIGTSYDNVLTTNGSDMAIRYILETFGEKGKEVVTVAPSFEMYWVNCSILGLKHVPVEYEKDFTISIDKIVEAISENTRIVVLLNPNNPMGNVYTEEEVEKVIRKTKEVGAVLIIDEAYHYFYDKTFIKYALEEDNVIVLRTFSKLMSIAACRIGVIISNPQIIHYIKNGRLTFDTNSIALLFAESIIDNPQLIENLISIEKEGKKYILDILNEKEYWCKDCMGNFIFIKTNRKAQEVAERLEKEKKILVHAYSNELLKDYIRVSVGSKKSMQIFIDAFLEIDGE